MGVLSVVLAAVAAFAVSGAWYMTLGRRWMAAVGRGEAESHADYSPLPFVISFVGYLLVAGMLRHILAGSGVTGVGAALVSGLGVGLFLVAPFLVTNHGFAGRPRALWWIDAGHVVLACAAIGAVLGAFA